VGTFVIRDHNVADRVLVVAEIGNNHEGRADVAAQLIDAAADAGADAVKFQTFQTRFFANPADEARYARLARFELPPEDFGTLSRRARKRGLLFVSTPLDLPSVDVLAPIVDAFKIASGDNDFLPLLDAVAATAVPLIISTGASDLETVRRAVDTVAQRRGHREHVALLQCTSAYPAPPTEVHLAAIRTLASEFDCQAGYSDHTLGIEAAVAAVAAGARIVEKHFTLDKQFSDFRDHQLSADPCEMADMVTRIRRIEEMLGSSEKCVQPSERDMVPAIRRSIVAAEDLSKGQVISAANLMWLRPAGGLRPGEESKLIGGTLRRDVSRGAAITTADVL
jgi:N,N'-diacetyllegionaminate synthase